MAKNNNFPTHLFFQNDYTTKHKFVGPRTKHLWCKYKCCLYVGNDFPKNMNCHSFLNGFFSFLANNMIVVKTRKEDTKILFVDDIREQKDKCFFSLKVYNDDMNVYIKNCIKEQTTSAISAAALFIASNYKGRIYKVNIDMQIGLYCESLNHNNKVISEFSSKDIDPVSSIKIINKGIRANLIDGVWYTDPVNLGRKYIDFRVCTIGGHFEISPEFIWNFFVTEFKEYISMDISPHMTHCPLNILHFLETTNVASYPPDTTHGNIYKYEFTLSTSEDKLVKFLVSIGFNNENKDNELNIKWRNYLHRMINNS